MCRATSTLPLLQKEKRREVSSGGDGVGEGTNGETLKTRCTKPNQANSILKDRKDLEGREAESLR